TAAYVDWNTTATGMEAIREELSSPKPAMEKPETPVLAEPAAPQEEQPAEPQAEAAAPEEKQGE
ncbi:MAG: hypothetical protein J6D38_02800, partial [Solobacterium sp.]|nr:hypothetical protein [Solobacterium sp.]